MLLRTNIALMTRKGILRTELETKGLNGHLWVVVCPRGRRMGHRDGGTSRCLCRQGGKTGFPRRQHKRLFPRSFKRQGVREGLEPVGWFYISDNGEGNLDSLNPWWGWLFHIALLRRCRRRTWTITSEREKEGEREGEFRTGNLRRWSDTPSGPVYLSGVHL